jgi:antitoxin component YwqK of YwqJK toxin-antitoxin module
MILLLSGCHGKSKEQWKGRKLVYYNDGRIHQIIDFDSLSRINGYYISFDTLGNVQRIQRYSSDTSTGEGLLFYQNGNLMSKTNYVQGRKEGVAYYFYENGLLQTELVWHMDSFTGNMREYDELGNQVFIHSKDVLGNGFGKKMGNK